MVMKDAAWVRPERLKELEKQDIERAQEGNFDAGSDYSSYYAYKIGKNRELIKLHAIADDADASEYVRNINAFLKMFDLGFKGNVIDLGCAIGIIPEHIRQIAVGDVTVTGIDISEVGIDVARRDYPACSFLCQPANDLSNFPDGYANVIHGREFYPFTRTNDFDFQRECLQGYLAKLKPGGAIVLSMVCLDKGLGTNWGAMRAWLLKEDGLIAERKMLIHRRFFSLFGKLCYRQPVYALLVIIQYVLGMLLRKKNTFIYVIVKGS